MFRYCKKYNIKQLILNALVASAAVMIVFSTLKLLRDPSQSPVLRQSSFAEPDQFNKQLNYLEAVVRPVAKYLHPEAPLQYIGLEPGFDFFQAAMAPRRLAAELDSPYLLFYFDSADSLQQHPDFQNTRLVVNLFKYCGVLSKGKVE